MSDPNWKKKKIPQNQQIFFFPILQLFPIFRKDIHGFQIGNLMKRINKLVSYLYF